MFWSASVPDFQSHLWHHIVLAWTGGRGLQVYFDGCLRQTDEGIYLANNENPIFNDFVFGNSNSALTADGFAGEMTLDEVRIWDADMDGEDVWKIYVDDIIPNK